MLEANGILTDDMIRTGTLTDGIAIAAAMMVALTPEDTGPTETAAATEETPGGTDTGITRLLATGIGMAGRLTEFEPQGGHLPLPSKPETLELQDGKY